MPSQFTPVDHNPFEDDEPASPLVSPEHILQQLQQTVPFVGARPTDEAIAAAEPNMALILKVRAQAADQMRMGTVDWDAIGRQFLEGADRHGLQNWVTDKFRFTGVDNNPFEDDPDLPDNLKVPQ